MDQENGIRRELEIVVEDLKHFGDGTRAICQGNQYNTYDSYSGGTCGKLQNGNFCHFWTLHNSLKARFTYTSPSSKSN
jgi:hypothetical protein